jgi:hypothetical protein
VRSRIVPNALPIAAAAIGLAVVGWLALGDWSWTDYDNEARPAFDALVGGHVLNFLQLAPAYGGSLMLRAPFVLIPKLWGGGELSMFRAAAAPCMAASAILAVWLVARMRTAGSSTLARVLALSLVVANPITLPALEMGHPEELLGAVLCVAAVLVAARGRALWAGVLLGLAIANKEWALVAVGPVLLALPRQRIRAALACCLTSATILAPLVLAGKLVTQVKGASQTGTIFSPAQFWWFLGSRQHLAHIGGGQSLIVRDAPAWVSGHAHVLIVALAIALALAYAWRRAPGASRQLNEPLLLLVLVLLLRCALDPWDISYYTLPFLIALTVWESLTFGRPPVLALAASFAAWFVFQWAPNHAVASGNIFLMFLGFALPPLVGGGIILYAPGLSSRVAMRLTRRGPVASPA